MPHIHTEPGQRDVTISAYIVRREDDMWKCMVHFHRKIEVLMQIGGHIELDETPWQAAAHELEEESGYQLKELEALQYTSERAVESGNILHPTPLLINTHNVGNDHYHSDLCFAFVAKALPVESVTEGESDDVRWLTLDELRTGAAEGSVLDDVKNIYEFLLGRIDAMSLVPATSFSLDKPLAAGVTYKRGAVERV